MTYNLSGRVVVCQLMKVVLCAREWICFKESLEHNGQFFLKVYTFVSKETKRRVSLFSFLFVGLLGFFNDSDFLMIRSNYLKF